MKKLLLILIALIQVTFALAQSFPVRVTPQAIPPYPTNLSGYANSGLMNSPLRVQLVLSDVTASSREVRLSVSIEGNGLNANSAQVVIGAPTLILDGGIPLNLTITELAPYFEQQNLQGLSSVQYNNPLADGTYRFCFEVFDAFNGNRLSSKSCATVFLINNDPPFLNKPDNESQITQQNPTNILFQWTPRHINVPNVSYEFSIVEVWDPYIDPQAIFLSSPPLYQEITTNTSLLYGPIQPLLLAGKRYAWRIRAFATNNGEEVSVFNNNGNSEVFWFDYQGNCELTTNIEVQDVSMTNATISWIGHPEHLDFTVEYREEGNDRWYNKTTPRNYITIDEFKPDTVYEYRVVGNCTENSFGQSPIDTFRTLSEEMAEYASCGIDPDPVDLSNQELLTELLVNDVFTAGDFPVYVKEVSGSGSFTGEGYISTPWLATVRIPIKFENIKINTDMKLVDGFVVTTYDPNWGSIVDADEIIEEIVGDDGDVDVINIDVDIVDIEINEEDGTITIITSDGDEITRPGGEDVVYVDNTGETWSVGEDGEVTTGEQAEGGPANGGNTDGVGSGGVKEITSKDVRIEFTKGDGYYSFDEVPKNAGGSIANKYDKVPISGGGEYNIPYKAVSNLDGHTSDILIANATFNNNDYTKDNVIFKTKEGVKVQANWNGNKATLSIRKAFDFGKQEIIATIKPKDSTKKYSVAGSANLWHLASQEVTDVSVTIIPVNNVSVSNSIAQQINAIYNPAGVNLAVTVGDRLNIDQSVWDLNGNGQLDVGDSSLLAQYTEEERAINTYFKTQTNYNNKTYYIFVTDLTTTDSGTRGFMPLKRQYGFIFDQNNVARTIAHELGHGIFGLEHPFTEYDTNSGATNLLMDYGTGTEFNHMDWEKMHAPGIQIYWFQGDEDGENIRDRGKFPEEFLNPDKESFTFISPTGDYIDLPKNVEDITFTFGIYDYEKNKNIVTGCLYSFKIGDKEYTLNNNGSQSLGYFNSNNEYYKPTDHFQNNSKYVGYKNNIIMGLPNTPNFIISKFKAENLKSEGTNNTILSESNFTVIPFSSTNPVEGNSKPYAYNKALIGEGANQLNTAYTQLLGSHNDKETLISVLKTIQLANTYKEAYRRFDECISEAIDQTNGNISDWYLVANNIFDWTLDTQSAIDCRAKIIPNSATLILNNDVKTYYNLYLEKFKEYLENNTSSCQGYFDSITETSEVDSIENCLSLLSDNEIKQINIDKRLLAISIMLNNWKVDDSQEKELIRLIQYTRDDDVDPLLTGLNSKSVLTDVDDFLLKKLVYKTDNDHVFFTEDNYKKLIYALAELTVGKSPNFRNRLKDLSVDDLIERNIKFYYKSFWSSIFGDLSTLWSVINGESIYSYDTKARWHSNESTDVEIYTNIYVGSESIASTEPLKTAAFDPIYFTNKSGLSMLSEYNKDKPVLSPAILTYYASDIGNTKTIVDGIQATVDVISIASGYGALARAPSFARKTFIIADMIGSGVSLTTNAIGNENLTPEAKAFLDALNILTATVAITELGTNAKNLKGIFTKVKNQGTDLPNKAAVTEFLNKLKASEGKLDGFDPNKIKEAKVWLAHLEMEASLGNVDDLKDKIEEAKRILSSLTDATENLANRISSFKNRLSQIENGLPNLRSKFDDLVNNESKIKFLNDFEGAEPEILSRLNLENGILVDAWVTINDLRPVLRSNIKLLESTNNLIKYDLFQNIGTASKGEISNINRYTVNGDYLNTPMRGPYTESPLSRPNVKLDDFNFQSYLALKDGLAKLRQTGRLESGFVTRGRTLSKEHYDILFGIGSSQEIPLKGFQSATRNVEVAKQFVAMTDFPGQKVKVLLEIKSKNGVYIDDLSDWGKTLGPINHSDTQPAIIRVQEEVLMEEGYFRKIAEPEPYIENGIPKVDIDSDGNEIPWMIIKLEELGTPLRQITN